MPEGETTAPWFTPIHLGKPSFTEIESQHAVIWLGLTLSLAVPLEAL